MPPYFLLELVPKEVLLENEEIIDMFLTGEHVGCAHPNVERVRLVSFGQGIGRVRVFLGLHTHPGAHHVWSTQLRRKIVRRKIV